MLEHCPEWLGQSLSGLRAGAENLCIAQPELGGAFGSIDLSSPSFGDNGRLPVRFTADGAGVSPPLLWGTLPRETRSLALIVESADSPTPEPLVHAIVWGISPYRHMLAEGAICADGNGKCDGSDVGLNSCFYEGWFPPDPPTGHGEHDYAFQLFALDQIEFPGMTPGRGALVSAMAGRVLAAGLLTGVYSRGEAAMEGAGLLEGALRTV